MSDLPEDIALAIIMDWRQIVGWPYEVSDHGAVRRSVRGGSPIAKAGRLLRPNHDRDGYPYVTLCDKPRTQTFKIHTLVCRAFKGPPPEGTDQVRHLDGCVTNNTTGNLCWGTALSNAADRKRHGTHGRGERSGKAKFTQAEVDVIRANHKASIGHKRVRRGWIKATAMQHGVSPITISCIVGGRGYN